MRVLLFLAALFISVISAYYSILGLASVFVGTIFLYMGASIEFAKIVAVSWLYRSWSTIPIFMRTITLAAVLVLMLFTSLGVFGYLSKAHMQNTVSVSSETVVQLEELKSEIDIDNKIIQDADKRLSLMDSTVTDYKILSRQTKARNQIIWDKKQATKRLRENNKKLAGLNAKYKEIEVKIGPLKYLAELVYGKENAIENQDRAVKYFILLLVIVFDPLAIVLFMAASKGATTRPSKKNKKLKNLSSTHVAVDKNDILHLEK